jgi:alpha-1,3-mannosyltransferase
MNVLLFAPALGILLLKRFGFWPTMARLLLICLPIQIVLAIPFLMDNPWGYLHMSFNFGREFMYKWTVNLKFLPETAFLNKKLHLGLLLCHLGVLLFFMNLLEERGLIGLLKHSLNLKTTATASVENARTGQQGKNKAVSKPQSTEDSTAPQDRPSAERIVTTMFVANFIGIIFSRSLHYQFYVWYFHTLPYLLWLAPFPNVLRVALLLAIEIVWNVYPARALSSLVLWICHLTLLAGLYVAFHRERQQQARRHQD